MRNISEEITAEYKNAVARAWEDVGIGQTGKRVPITDLFLMLQVMERPDLTAQESHPKLAQGPEQLKHVEGKKRPSEKQNLSSMSLSSAVAEIPHLVLLGEPGAGKSLALQFIGFCLAKPDQSINHLNLAKEWVPIQLDLKEYSEKLASSTSKMIEAALAEKVEGDLHRLGEEDPLQVVAGWRNDGDLLLLLDGLDEVPYPLRKNVSDNIRNFAKSLPGRKCRVIVTSRMEGYTSLGKPFQEYTLKPFQNRNDVKPYVLNWLKALKSGWDDSKAADQADKFLYEMMHQPGLKRILDNPLLLRMAIELFATTKEIAKGRTNLYELYIENVAWDRASLLGATEKQKDLAMDTLETLAWQSQNNLKISKTNNIPLVREKLGLVVQQGEELIFSHRTFREYFVSKHIAKSWLRNQTRTWKFLRPRIHNDEWYEPLLLLIGELNAKRATNLIRHVMKSQSSYEKTLRRDLLLAAELVGEWEGKHSNLPKHLVRRITKKLQRRLHSFFTHYSQKRHAAIALARIDILALSNLLQSPQFRRNRNITSLLEKKVSENSILLSFVQNQVDDFKQAIFGTLNEVKKSDISTLRLLLNERDLIEPVVRTLGHLRDPKIVPDLLEILQQPGLDIHVREAVIFALGEIGDPLAIQLLTKEVSGEASIQALNALGQIGAPAIPTLLQMMEQDELRGSIPSILDIMRILGKIGDIEVIPYLCKWLFIPELGDIHVDVFRAIWDVINRVGNSAIPALLPLLQDSNPSVRAGAVYAIGEIKATNAIFDLHQLLEDQDRSVRHITTEALGKICDPRSVLPLIRALQKSGISKERLSEKSILKYGSTAIPELVKMLHGPVSSDRRAAAHWLGKISDPAGITALIIALQHQDWDLRMSATDALGEIGNNKAIPSLLSLLREVVAKIAKIISLDPKMDRDVYATLLTHVKNIDLLVTDAIQKIDSDHNFPQEQNQHQDEEYITAPLERWGFYQKVGTAIINALGNIGDKSVVLVLCEILERGFLYNYNIAKALGKIGDPQAIPYLVNALHDDKSTYGEVAEALGKIGARQAIRPLVQGLKNASPRTKETILKALGDIRDPQVIPVLSEMLKRGDQIREVMVVLAKIGTPEAFDIILEVFDTSDWEFSTRLMHESKGAVLPSLIQLFSNSEIWKLFYYYSITETSKEIGEPVIPVLDKMINDRDLDIEKRRIAVAILCQFGPLALSSLLQIINNQDAIIRKRAVQALGETGDSQIIPNFLSLLSDKDRDVRLAAALVLGEMGRKESIPILLDEWPYDERTGWENQKMVEILAKLGGAESVPYLLKLDIRYPEVDNALEMIGNQIEDVKLLTRISKKFQRHHYFSRQKLITSRIEKLQFSKDYFDPLEPWAIPPGHQRMIATALFGITVIIFGLLALLTVLSGVVQDLLKDEWTMVIKNWMISHPAWSLVFLTLALGSLSGLLIWILDVLKSSRFLTKKD